jgi:peroxiredoxin
MATAEPRSPVQPGEPAPGFSLPAVHREGTVSLAEYQGQRPLLLALLRELY